MKTAVIVAAGLSSRLYPLTKDLPKSLLPLSEESILERHVRLLKKHGFERIIIIVGYLKEKIKERIGETVEYIFNPFFKQCNNMGSLWYANFKVAEPFLYLHADLIYSEKLLSSFLKDVQLSDALIDFALDQGDVDQEAMKVQCAKNGKYIRSMKELPLEDSSGEWIGLAYIRNPSVIFKEIENLLGEGHLDVYDTYAFNRLAQRGYDLSCHSIKEEWWIEVDFLEDYEKAKKWFR